MINDVRPPVEELAAAILLDRLPVVTAGITYPTQLDFEHITKYAGGDDLPNMLKAWFKASIVPNVKLTGRLGGYFLQLDSLCISKAHRLL